MIAIIDYGSGNIRSVQTSLDRLGVSSQLTTDPEVIRKASHVILPGVGAANAAMAGLRKNNLVQVICELTQPFLGICLGKQLLYQFSEEGNTDCFKILEGIVTKLNPQPSLPIPHMGWNLIHISKPSDLFRGINKQSYVYFVHSYAAAVSQLSCATTSYHQTFSAAVQYNNFFGVQFHPEKSGEVGEKILANFLSV